VKKVLVKNMKGDMIDSFECDDPTLKIAEGIKANTWGLPQREKNLKECTPFELSRVVKILPPDRVEIMADYSFEIRDVQSEILEKQKNRQQIKDLIRDWDALFPPRKEKIVKRILTKALEKLEIEVLDL